MNQIVDTAITKKRWLIELLHRVHPTPYSLTYTNDDSLRIHLDYLVSKRDSLWIAPYGEVVRYIKERDSSAFFLKEYSDSTMVFSLTNRLDDSIYDLPLSLEVQMREDAQVESAYQGGDTLSFRNDSHDNKHSVRLAAYPNKGEIVIRGSNLGPVPKPVWIVERKAGDWIGRASGARNTWIFRPPYAGAFTLKAFDLSGKGLVRDYVFRASPGYAYEMRMQADGFPRGRTVFAIYSRGKLVAKRSITLD
jgi:hypothetical protein